MAEKIVRKTVSVRLALSDWNVLHNVADNRDCSIQSLLEPVVRGWLKDVPESDKVDPEPEDTEADKA